MDTLTPYKQGDSSWRDMRYDYYVKRIDTTRSGRTIIRIDTTFWTVKEKGCAISVLAMMLKYWGKNETPGTLVQKMTPKYINRKGETNWLFVDTYGGLNFARADGDFPPAIEDSTGNIIKTPDGKDSLDFSEGKALSLDTLKHFTSRCIPVGVYVVNPDRNTNHFVMVTGQIEGDYTILDPGRNRSLLSRYRNSNGTIYGLRYIHKK
ncbi:MAG TPA: hypothetical protein VJN65_04320 [Bacteroidota bacterium]|nr:hypothetical protein [Bacteroidota bacterium]